ncbi:recombinase family protein [Streptomyces sp. gCLA4]|uniref:recombinase family protein n=1 Tax=Streptomyces sp. gCLA4 TaxID=1873416 RepID=UPI0015FFAE4A
MDVRGAGRRVDALALGLLALGRVGSRPEAVVCWHTDRLVRVTKDLERVIALGVNVHAARAGHLDLSTPAGRAVARTVTAWATYEGEQKAERQALANLQAAKAGKPYTAGIRPSGTARITWRSFRPRPKRFAKVPR